MATPSPEFVTLPPLPPSGPLTPARRLLSWRLVRYLLVGGGLFVLDTAVFLTLVRLFGWDLRLAQLVSRTVGAATGFVGHRGFTFRQPGKDHAHSVAAQGTGYVAVTLFNIAFSPFVVQFAAWAVPGTLPFSLVLAKIAAECVIVVESFLLLNVVFRQRERK